MTSTKTSTVTAPTRNVGLTATRIVAGLIGAMQLAGVVYFVVIAPEEAGYVGLVIDVPVVAALLTGVLLKLGVALWPGLAAARRITMGFAAVAIGVAVTLVKIPVYDEPESATFLVLDAVLLALLLLARRGNR